jgi:hypothetical protein
VLDAKPARKCRHLFHHKFCGRFLSNHCF